MAKSSFLRHAAVYGAGNLLVYAAGFLLLPLYVRCLSESEYGTLDVFNRLAEVVLLFLLCNGLQQGLISFHNQARDDAECRAVVGSALLLTVVMLGGGCTAALLAADPLSRWLGTGEPGLLRLAVVSVLVEALLLMLLALAQARVQSLLFAAVSFGQFLIRAALCIVLVAGLGWGIEGVLLASITASGLVVAGLLLRELYGGGLRVDRAQLRALARFALPFLPGGFGFFILNSGDRFFLLRYVSRAEVGAYALGYKLAVAVRVFSRHPLYKVWSAHMYEAARRPDAALVFGRVFTRVLAAYVAVGLALCLAQGEVVGVLSGGDFGGAAAVVAPVVLAYLFLTMSELMDAGFYVRRRTALKLPIMLSSTAVTLALYALLIPPWGMHGAALATLLGFLFHAGLTLVISQRIFFVRYEWGRVAALVGWAAALWLASRGLPAGWWGVAAKAALWLLWPLGLWHAGVVNDEEKKSARAIARGAGRWAASLFPKRPAGTPCPTTRSP